MLRNNNKKRRSYIEICAEILRLAREGAKKTHLVYKANLNFVLLGKYLLRMEKAGLVTYDRQIVKTTEKGLEYVRGYKKLNNVADLRT